MAVTPALTTIRHSRDARVVIARVWGRRVSSVSLRRTLCCVTLSTSCVEARATTLWATGGSGLTLLVAARWPARPFRAARAALST